MASGHSVLNMLNQNSKAGIEDIPKARFRTKDISIKNIYRNERNFYGIREVEELAGKILMAGLLENLVVVYDPTDAGEYRLISGERRLAALQMLVEREHTEFAVVTCQIRPKASSEVEEFELISANAQRIKTPGEELEEEKRLKKLLEAMKSQGQKIKGYDLSKGRLRDVVAQMLGKSPTKIAQMESINNRLISGLRERLDAGSITFSTAYELSGLPEDRQRAALEQSVKAGEPEVTHKEAKAMKAEPPTNAGNSQSKQEPVPTAELPEVQREKPESGSMCQNVTHEKTKLEGAGICPFCRSYFDPTSRKPNGANREYTLDCPNCGKSLNVIEKTVYEISVTE